MIFRLLRVQQWYKNAVIFLPLIFSGELFDRSAIISTLVGFFALSLISSSNYIINDITDRKMDRKHPDKKNRPIASGKIKLRQAVIIAIFLLSSGMYLSYKLSFAFLGFSLSLFVLTQTYTFLLKKEAFADILLISTNFVIRTTSGAFVISDNFMPYVRVSSWLILCPFFLALFLSSNKRRAEVMTLKKKSTQHRSVLGVYDEKLTSSLQIISTTLLVMSYSLYVFFSPYPYLILTLPFVLYIFFHYFHVVKENPDIGMHPHRLYKDKRMIISTFITLIISFCAIYLV